MQTEPVVWIVDDDLRVRCWLQQLIETVNLNTRAYSTAREFLDEFDEQIPGCLVLDVRLSGMSGLDLQDELIRRHARIPVIVISGFGDVSTAVRAMRAGALDFLEKPFPPQTLLDRIGQALEIDAKNRRRKTEREAFRRRLARLSGRQRQVLEMIVEGKTTGQIARGLGLSAKTVYAHRAEALAKIDATSVAEAAQRVLADRVW